MLEPKLLKPTMLVQRSAVAGIVQGFRFVNIETYCVFLKCNVGIFTSSTKIFIESKTPTSHGRGGAGQGTAGRGRAARGDASWDGAGGKEGARRGRVGRGGAGEGQGGAQRFGQGTPFHFDFLMVQAAVLDDSSKARTYFFLKCKPDQRTSREIDRRLKRCLSAGRRPLFVPGC